jgi:small subunit ribosomal protein S6e
MGNEFPGETLDPKFAGYIFKITGGNDKDGFCMRQGILKNGRVRILMDKNQKCYRQRRKGERKRKSVRGCIVGKDIGVLALSIVKHGEIPIEGILISLYMCNRCYHCQESKKLRS